MKNTTAFTEASGDKNDIDVVVGAVCAVGVLIIVGFVVYCIKKHRGHNRAGYVVGETGQSDEGLDYPDGVLDRKLVMDPLEKKPYTQLTFPHTSQRTSRSKYGVCQYKTKRQPSQTELRLELASRPVKRNSPFLENPRKDNNHDDTER